MDSCQLIRKEAKMEVAHLNQKQLAARWSISEATLERWRSEGIGPKFLKLCGRVLYRRGRADARRIIRAHQSALVGRGGDRRPGLIRALPKGTMSCPHPTTRTPATA